MRTAIGVMAVAGLALAVGATAAGAQAKPGCDAQGRPTAPVQLQGQVLKVNAEQGTLTVRTSDGQIHDFQASKETLQEYKVGDHIEAKLRQAASCR